jgi:DNA topoisomerase-1
MNYIIRILRGKSKHIYIDKKGKQAKTKDIEYAKTLVIPPAYPFSVIFLNPKNNKSNGILAISYDDKGRKQYKYTQSFIQSGAEQKYKNLVFLIEHIDIINQRSKRDLKSGNENAIIIRILLECYLRIGSKHGVNNYDHYGISTLKKKHIRFGKINGTQVCYISFVGKKGVLNECVLKEKGVVSKLKDIYLSTKKNDFLFNEATPASVNAYLQDIYPILSSKMIRTYGANYLLLKSLRNIDPKLIQKSERQKKIFLNSHIEKVACTLQNTKTILKNSYIIPELMKRFMVNHDSFLATLKKKSIHQFLLTILRSR